MPVTKNPQGEARTRIEIEDLHKEMMQSFFSLIQSELNKDAVNGVVITELKEVLKKVTKKFFPFLLPQLSIESVSISYLQSFKFDGDSVVMLGVESGLVSHAVLIEGVLHRGDEGFSGDDATHFQLLIRDPHQPEKIRLQNVYRKAYDFFIEGYGKAFDEKRFVGPGRSSVKIRVGEIYRNLVLRYGAIREAQEWNYEKLQRIPDIFKGRVARIFLKNGMTLEGVTVFPEIAELPRQYLGFKHSSGRRDEIPFREVADIEFL